MNKILLTSVLSAVSLAASAQGAYDAGNIIQTDLVGSARYVGMGGALNALGADITLMSTNPAGTGLYRRSDVGVTLAGLVSGQKGLDDYSKSKMSLDQAGVVFTYQVDNSGSGLQFVNFGVNYKKNHNFFGNNSLDIMHLNGECSQTNQIANMADYAYHYKTYYGEAPGLLTDIATQISGHNGIVLFYPEDPVDKYDANGQIIKDGQGKPVNSYFAGLGAKKAGYSRSTFGSNIEADVNVSFNVSDRFYYGMSVGIYNVDYNRESFYYEEAIDGYYYDFLNWYRTTGTGVDLKFGFICRPIEDSSFRIGLSVHTPTWYSLTDANGASLYEDAENGYVKIADGSSGDYDYKLNTPWMFNLALGHTIGSSFAIGAEYEFTDYSSAKYKPMEAYDRNYMNDVNNHMQHNVLKSQHTLKLGVEYKPSSSFSVRAGYNYVSSAYKKDGFKTILDLEPFTDTDYANLGAINRFTLGCGYNWKGGYLDLAYQYQTQKGDFYAFDDVNLRPTTIKNNRSHIMATLGFRF